MRRLLDGRNIVVSVGWLIAVALAVLCASHSKAEGPQETKPGANHATSAPASQPGAESVHALMLPGIIAPDERVDLYAKASGYVAKINVDIGSRVRHDDVLIELAIPELQDEIRQMEATLGAKSARAQALMAKAEQARLMIDSAQAEEHRVEAEHDLAKITFDRKAELFKGKVISDQEYDVVKNALLLAEAELSIARAKRASAEGGLKAAQADTKAAEAEVAVAKADLARVRTLLDYASIRAPFDGVITHRNVDHGTFVRSATQGAGSPLLTIDKMDRVRLVVDIPEENAPFIQAGSTAEIQVRAWGASRVNANVTRTAMAIRSDSRTMRAEIDLDNQDGKLLPGMYARVTLAMPAAAARRPGA